MIPALVPSVIPSVPELLQVLDWASLWFGWSLACVAFYFLSMALFDLGHRHYMNQQANDVDFQTRKGRRP